jgi:hypothetical protein
MLVNGLLSTEDNRLVPIRNDKPNDSGNEMVKVCSNRTTVTKLIIGDSQSTGCALRVIKYENNKLNGLVKPETGVDILLNSARKDIVNLMERVAIVFCGGANIVGTSNSQMVLKYHRHCQTVVTLTSFR